MMNSIQNMYIFEETDLNTYFNLLKQLMYYLQYNIIRELLLIVKTGMISLVQNQIW